MVRSPVYSVPTSREFPLEIGRLQLFPLYYFCCCFFVTTTLMRRHSISQLHTLPPTLHVSLSFPSIIRSELRIRRTQMLIVRGLAFQSGVIDTSTIWWCSIRLIGHDVFGIAGSFPFGLRIQFKLLIQFAVKEADFAFVLEPQGV